MANASEGSFVDDCLGSRGFRTVAGLSEIAGRGNTVLGHSAILIAAEAEVGTGNVIYPGVVIEIANGGSISIGDGNILYPGTFILADAGVVVIGSRNQFGDGGVSVKANRQDSRITIGDGGRFVNGPEIIGCTELGNGSQVLGKITVQDCRLEGGVPYSSPQVERRGAVLKGFGLARGISLARGQVLQGLGVFDVKSVLSQTAFHPKEAKNAS